MSLFKWLKKIIEQLFGSPPPDLIKIEPKLVSITVEEIAFPESNLSDAIFPNLVIDFGTTATVVGATHLGFRYSAGVRLDFLAGEREFESAMSIDADGNVSAVGPNAYTDSRAKPDHRYVTSMKRYLELASRGDSSAGFHTIVCDFLIKAVKERYRAPLGQNSEIVISVPNSFNPRAVEDIRTGVVYAINDLNHKINQPELMIDRHNIKIVRESEAVAYLYSHRGSIQAPTMEEKEPGAPFTWDSLHSANQKQEGPERIIVLDIGGGTTDLSLVEVDQKASSNRVVKVILNAGVALGGTDVDKLLFRELMDEKVNFAKIFKDWPIDQRVDLLNRIRTLKDSDANQIFKTPGLDEPDPFRRTLSEWMTQIPEPVRRFSPGQNECTEADTSAYRAEIDKRLKKLIRLSIIGLFDLIGENTKTGVSKILLTGRAARLNGICEAVIELGQKLKADVKYLHHRYHAKLVVAYGCALVQRDEFAGSRLPSGTLGRTFQVNVGSSGVFASFGADFPVSGDAPTLFRARFPGLADHPRSYVAGEFKTDVPSEFFDTTDDWPGDSGDYMEWLGCGRAIAKWDLRVGHLPQGAETRYLLWHPVTETYYSIHNGKWSDRRSRTSFSWSNLNYVTGLPLGFPHEEMERKLGLETEGEREA